ncbi:heat shock 22 kDa protein, mitochondrial-like [Primulina huaijiensis]|uniref:heat shock 22 kDa protein, mitochondrial-like n=1 Tax=Primulina huaijiensis TaxID=1492673 RepID=UPI003CC77DBC
MASSLVLRKAAGGVPVHLARLLRASSVAPTAVHGKFYLSTETDVTPHANENRRVDVDRRSGSSVGRRGESFSDIFNPFSTIRGLSQMLNMMDRFMGNPFDSGFDGAGWIDSWEDDASLYLRVDMPGLDKEQVKVWVEQNTLVIKGEGSKVSEDGNEHRRRYYRRMDLPWNMYKLDGVKAEMKNGVLKVVVPKLTGEERKDAIQVCVD